MAPNGRRVSEFGRSDSGAAYRNRCKRSSAKPNLDGANVVFYNVLGKGVRHIS